MDTLLYRVDQDIMTMTALPPPKKKKKKIGLDI